MHSEYGWEATSEGKHFNTVKGLQAVSRTSANLHSIPTPLNGAVYDAQELYLGYDQIEVETPHAGCAMIKPLRASLENASYSTQQFGNLWIFEFSYRQ